MVARKLRNSVRSPADLQKNTTLHLISENNTPLATLQEATLFLFTLNVTGTFKQNGFFTPGSFFS